MIQIGVIGSAGPEEYPKNKKPDSKIFEIAEKLGELIAQNNAVLITGGKSGIMKTAAKGAKKYNGTTIGIVKGDKRGTANKYIDIEIPTNTAGEGEEAILVNSCDAIIVVGGGAGTLQELACAYRKKKTVIAINNVGGVSEMYANKYLDERKSVKIASATSAEKAISLIFEKIK